MNNKFFNIFITLILGIISGVFGSILLLSSDYSKDLVFNEDSLNNSFIIEKTEEYNINENIAIENNVMNSKEYMVYIARKNDNNLYKKDDIETSGFFVTSNGWSVISKDFLSFMRVKEGFDFKEYIKDSFVLLDYNKDIHEISDSIITNSGVIFVKIEKNVKNIINIANDSDSHIGSKVFSFNKYGEFNTFYIKDKVGDKIDFGILSNSDENPLWFFNLSNKLVGFYNLNDYISAENIRYYLDKVKSDVDDIYFNNIEIKYIDLNSDLYGYDKENYKLGFLVEKVLDKDLPFLEDDIIIEINGYKVYNSLEFMLKSLSIDSYEFKVLRNEEELILEVKN
jgi:hypothetical protein